MGVTGVTNNKLFSVLTYDNNNPYQVGKNGVLSITNAIIEGIDYTVLKYNIDGIVYTSYVTEENLDLFNVPLTNVSGNNTLVTYRKTNNNRVKNVGGSNTEKLLSNQVKSVGSKFSTTKTTKELPTTNQPNKKRLVKTPQRLSFLNYFGDTTFETNKFSFDNFTSKNINKKEKYIGLIDLPKIKSDIFMERDSLSVMERHHRMSDINSLQDLVIYKNEYFKMIKTV